MIPGLPPLVVLERIELSVAAASVTVPASGTIAAHAKFPTYGARHVVVIVNTASEDAVAERNLEATFNSDGGANYNDQYLKGTGAADSAARADGQTELTCGAIPGTTVDADAFGGGSILIPDAFNTARHKAVLAHTGAAENSVYAVAGRWASPAAVTDVTVAASAGNLAVGTTVTLCVVDEKYRVADGESILLADGTFTFSNLPQTRGDLSVIGSLRSDDANVIDAAFITINGDGVGGNYAHQALYGMNAGPPAASSVADQRIGIIPADTATASVFGPLVAAISQHALPDNDPHYLSISGFHEATGANAVVGTISGRRDNQEPVHTIAFAPSAGTLFKTGSAMWVYFVPKRLLERVVLTVAAASVAFASISQNYRHLRLNVYGRSDTAGTSQEGVHALFNGDAVAANYDYQRVYGIGAAVTANQAPASPSIGEIPRAGEAANIFEGFSVLISEYASATKHKHRLSVSGARGSGMVAVYSSRWESTAAVTDITVQPAANNFVAGSVFELEGIGRVDDNIWAEIDGVEVQKEKDSLVIRNAIEARDTCEFTVVDQAGTATYSKGQPVEVLQNCAVMFGGIIDSVKRRKFQESTTVFHAIRATGYAALLDKRLAAESYVAQTAEFIVRDLAGTYMNPEGIWLGNIETGPTIAEMIVNYSRISRVLDALGEKAGFEWNVDELKRLTFQARTTVLASDSIDVDMITKLTPRVTEQAPDYRNRQIIRAGRGVTSPQTETFTGDGVTVAFTVGYPINAVPTVTVNAVGQTVGIKGLETGRDCYWNKSDATITFDVGSIPGAVAVVIVYTGEYPLVIIADEPGKIASRQAVEGGTGIWEDIDDEPAITDVDAARDSAVAKLDRFSTIGQVFILDTVEAGFEPGQLVPISWLTLGDMLIESVETREIRADKPTFRITAIVGPSGGDWTRFFRGLADQKDEVLDRLTIGRDELVIIVVREADTWEWDEAVTETVFACPVVGVGLVPLVTLFPC